MKPSTKVSIAVLLLLGVGIILLQVSRPHWVRGAGGTADRFARFDTPACPVQQGAVLIVFSSADCDHCRDVARLISSFDAAAHDLGVLFIVHGMEEDLDRFLQETAITAAYLSVPADDFVEFAEEDPPTVYLLQRGREVIRWGGSDFNLQLLEAQLQELDDP